MAQHEKELAFDVTTRSSRSSNSSTSSSSSSTTTTSSTGGGVTTAPGVRITDDQWDEIASYYERCIGVPITLPMGEEIREYNEHYGIGYDVIRMAIRETGMARRPSPRYLLAILDRCACEEVTTLAEWRAAKAAFRSEKAMYGRREW